MPRPKGPFLPLRKFKDEFEHQKHWGFLRWRAQCKYRGEEVDMTMEEYFDFWPNDLWVQRGRQPDSLVMVRLDVEKPWSTANCVIVTRYQQLCRGKKMHRKIRGLKDIDL